MLEPLPAETKRDIAALKRIASKKLSGDSLPKRVRDHAEILDRIARLGGAGDPDSFEFFGSNDLFRALLDHEGFLAIEKLFFAYNSPYDEKGRTAILLINRRDSDSHRGKRIIAMPINMKAIEEPGKHPLLQKEFAEPFVKIAEAEAKRSARRAKAAAA